MGWIEDTLASRKSNDLTQKLSSKVITPVSRWMDRHFWAMDEDKRQDQKVILALACATTFGLGVWVGRARPFSQWQRLLQLQDLPSSAMGPNAKYFRGRAVTVSDGDTLRFYHVPTWFHSSDLPDGAKMSDMAWPVRVCTIDTPETAKFGKAGQPFGEDAKGRLTELVKGQTIHVQVLTRDQYGRAVAQVKVGGGWWFPFSLFLPKYADQVMLQDGLAEVYRGSGAVYGDKGVEYYEQLEAKAQDQQKGMWSLGDERESAAEYKARTKQ